MSREGIYVVLSSAAELVAVIGGERYVARFLFTPSALRVGDRVWLRIERQIDGTEEEEGTHHANAADVTARITRVYPRSDGSVPTRPHRGMAFLMTIDAFDAAARSDERTHARYAAALAPDDEEAPTEKVQWRTDWEDTLRDADPDVVAWGS